MKSQALQNMGIPAGETLKLAQKLIRDAREFGVKKGSIRRTIAQVIEDPELFTDDPLWAELAKSLKQIHPAKKMMEPRAEPAPWLQWGHDLESESIQQMVNACRLPITVSGALMPDAHVGYGLPIGGVLATEQAVIPYAVGVDIACRMMMSVIDMPVDALDTQRDSLIRALQEETRFGIGACFGKKTGKKLREHEVMDQNWQVTSLTAYLKDKAWSQLGTSGSGNHFVEYGIFTLEQPDLNLEAGRYLALLSHSGSRGSGNSVATHYSKLAMNQHRELPRELQHLAWLDLQSDLGQEYWRAMELMGDYASANHHVIHREILKALGTQALVQIENHHNFAWKEMIDGRELIIHRKGATPAHQGVLGIIPGSMATPGFVVRGKGQPTALYSASHGAGRQMSRRQAKQSLNWKDLKQLLRQKDITVLSADLDESPVVYKNIHAVMSQQSDLVDIIAQFDPKIVKMAPPGERPED